MAPIAFSLVDKIYNKTYSFIEPVLPEALKGQHIFIAPTLAVAGMYGVTRTAQFFAKKIDEKFPGFYDRFAKFERLAAIGVPVFALGYALFDPEGARSILHNHDVYMAGMTGLYFGGLGAIAQDLSKRQKQRLEDKLMRRAELVNEVPVFTINAPKNYVGGYIAKHKGKDNEPDRKLRKVLMSIGDKVNSILEHNYHGQELVIRTVSSHDHEEEIDELVNEITLTGTDRNNPTRPGKGYGKAPGSRIYGVSYDMAEPADFQRQLLKHIKTSYKRGHNAKPQDIIIIYAKDRMKPIPYSRASENTDGRRDLAFAFEGGSKEALVGVIKIK